MFRGTCLAASLVLAVPGCLSGATRRTIASAESTARDFAADAQGEPGATPRAPDDPALAGPIDLPAVEAAALARHPSLVEAVHRVRALAAQARAEGSLPSPELMTELWHVPLSRPYALDAAGMFMVSLRQPIPAPGSLDRTADATAQEARAAAAMVLVEARALLREVDRAFADYVEAHARHASHVEHLALTERMSAAARARYAAGAPLSDITKADLERARLEAEIAREEGSVAAARARLNGLLARPAGAPLGPPHSSDPVAVRLPAPEVAERVLARSPEIAAAEATRRAAASKADAARIEATVPSFSVGLNYFHPVGGMPAGWGASVGMSLPWLWGGASRRTESANERALAERAAAENARVRARAGAAQALALATAAERRLLVLRDVARPAARRSLDAAIAGYAAGGTDILAWLDAQRASLDVDLELSMARADLDRALADLDAAVGERVPRAPIGFRSPVPSENTQ